MNGNLRAQVLELMGRADYEPLNKSELSRKLDLQGSDRSSLRILMDELERDHSVVRLKKGRFALKVVNHDLVTGRIRRLKSGKCLFIPDKGDAVAHEYGWDTESIPKIIIQPNRLNTAMDGDRVAVSLQRSLPKGWKKHRKGRPSSLEEFQIKVRVENILVRRTQVWVGTFRPTRSFGKVFGDGISSPEYIELTEKPKQPIESGMLVTVSPVSWGEGRIPSRGTVLEVLGYPKDPHVDMEAVIRKYQLPRQFPQDVIRNTEELTEDLDQQELARREDWTDRPVMTIDPEGARDFDDAIHVTRDADGWELAVHIADVSHYVAIGSPLDEEAMKRGNSTYLPDRVIPMLPPRLCDDLCSLRAGVIRLTKVCVMRFNTKGERIKTKFADAYIRNERQMTYPEAYQLMNGKGKDDLSRMLKDAWDLASLLRRKRFANGALDLDFPEVRVLLDTQGKAVKIVSEEYDESHQMIEECMLAANEAVAEALKNKNRPTIYRVHEDPDEAKLNAFGELCKVYGHTVHDLTNKKNLMTLLASIKGSPDEQIMKISLLKSLMRARYDTSPLGHYGLSKTNYCHFTSPIRRYADLVVHRSLNALLDNPPANASRGAGSVARLQEIADHISDTERVSASAEKESNMIKLMEWLEEQTHAQTPEVHRAIISEVRHFGLLVEIPRLQIKGLVKPDSFPKGNWRYESFADRWSHSKGSSLQPGRILPVIPVKVDRDKQWVDFAVVRNLFEKEDQ